VQPTVSPVAATITLVINLTRMAIISLMAHVYPMDIDPGMVDITITVIAEVSGTGGGFSVGDAISDAEPAITDHDIAQRHGVIGIGELSQRDSLLRVRCHRPSLDGMIAGSSY